VGKSKRESDQWRTQAQNEPGRQSKDCSGSQGTLGEGQSGRAQISLTPAGKNIR
jgi:hypothetical protein